MTSGEGIEVIYIDGVGIKQKEFKEEIKILKNSFICTICKDKKKYPDEYGGTYKEGEHVYHLCIDCIPTKLLEVIFHDRSSSY